MLKKTLLSLALIGAGALGLPAAPAMSAALPVAPQPFMNQAADNPLATQVNHRDSHRGTQRMGARNEWRNWNNRRNNRVVVYDRYRHGPRCAHWANNCRHYHNGYWYGSPWWTFPVVGAGIVIGSTIGNGGYGSRHVAWCESRYRSYNIRINTWVAYSGDVRECISPYGP
jgi:hypothetical protein